MEPHRGTEEGRQAQAGWRRAPLPRPDDLGAAEAAAVRILAGSGQSRAGLTRRLVRRGFDQDTAASAVAAMARRGYVDDVALAGSVAARRVRDGYGRGRIVADLRARGIDAADIDQVLGAPGAPGEAGEDERARVVTRRLWPLRRGEDERHRRTRVAAALGRRGYGPDVVSRQLRMLATGEGEPATE
jgi:regulatory protein